MAKWTMSEALAAELLAGLEQAARERAAGLAGETARQTAAYLGLGWLEEETGQALLGLSGLREGVGAGTVRDSLATEGIPVTDREQWTEAARASGAGTKTGTAGGAGQSGGAAGGLLSTAEAAAGTDMARVSRFFERDARRYG